MDHKVEEMSKERVEKLSIWEEPKYEHLGKREKKSKLNQYQRCIYQEDCEEKQSQIWPT